MRQTARGTAHTAANIKDMHVWCKSGKLDQFFRCDITADMKLIHWLKIIKCGPGQILAKAI